MTFLCTLATKWAKISSIYSKITKLHPIFIGIFRQNHTHACLGIFCVWEKVTQLERHTPEYTLLGEYSPPPPPDAPKTWFLVLKFQQKNPTLPLSGVPYSITQKELLALPPPPPPHVRQKCIAQT